jgi:mannose-6-phosphate isomerase-like protein (cupin superfamily)
VKTIFHPPDGLARVPGPAGERFAVLLRHGSLVLELYAPRGRDLQLPHTRDELYVVVSGHGQFDIGGDVQSFAPGDALFVPAHRPHRFVDFSDDFAAWVVFYGPEGGEPP